MRVFFECSDVVIIGTVVSKEDAKKTYIGDKTSGTAALITTDFTLSVLETSDPEKLGIGETVTMRMKGGETDEYKMTVEGSDPNAVNVGETYLFFLGQEYEDVISPDGTTDPDTVYRSSMRAEYSIFAQDLTVSPGTATTNSSENPFGGTWRALAGDLVIDDSVSVTQNGKSMPLLSAITEN